MSDSGQFGLYIIPQSGERLYEVGSRVLGYDIRAAASVPSYDYLRPAWQQQAAQYGFHCTVTDAVDIEFDRLPDVADEAQSLLACLNGGNGYTLRLDGLAFWTPQLLVYEATASPLLVMLHTLLVSRLHPLGSGTLYARSGLQPVTEADRQKMKRFHTPYIFDNFRAHFNCLGDFDGTEDERADVLKRLTAEFGKLPDIITIDRLVMVARRNTKVPFSVYREFALPSAR